MPEDQRNYGKWSSEELRKAEATASQFLAENSSQIADTMRAKTKFLETLIQRISQPRTSFQDRLEYLARVSEIADLIRADADGFFELASQPMVARILGTVKKK
jgi:GAF domain-containing protein